MDAKPINDEGREPMGRPNVMREPTIPAPGQLRTMPPRHQGGQLPTAEVDALCAQVKGTIAALTRVSEHCTRTRNEIERLVNELADMIGKP